MKKTRKWTQLKLPKIVKKTLVFVYFLLGFDVLLAGFVATYLGETAFFFFNRSMLVILSNLVFLEGAIIFSIGAFIEFGQSFQHTRPSDKLQNEQNHPSQKVARTTYAPRNLYDDFGSRLYRIVNNDWHFDCLKSRLVKGYRSFGNLRNIKPNRKDVYLRFHESYRTDVPLSIGNLLTRKCFVFLYNTVI